MSNDSKCFFGLHHYEIIEQHKVFENVVNNNEVTQTEIGINYVLRCTNCGKVKSKFVGTDSDYVNKPYR